MDELARFRRTRRYEWLRSGALQPVIWNQRAGRLICSSYTVRNGIETRSVSDGILGKAPSLTLRVTMMKSPQCEEVEALGIGERFQGLSQLAA